jgi:hypothetical protein
MSAAVTDVRLLSISQAARMLQVDCWMLRRVCDKKIVVPLTRVGRVRVLDASQLPACKAGLIELGYLHPDGTPAEV